MKKGDISNEDSPIYGIDFDSIFVSLDKKLPWWDRVMVTATRGRWLAHKDLLKPRPGVVPFVRDIAKFCNVIYYLVNTRISAHTALKILERYNFPVHTIKEVYEITDLRDELGYDMVNVFYTANTNLYPAYTGPMGVLVFDWRHAPPARGISRTS